MKTIEILAGDGIANAFEALNIKATKTYTSHLGEVWEITEDDFDKLNALNDWRDDWGWYRCGGSVIADDPETYPTTTFKVRDKELIAYYNIDDFNDWLDDLNQDDDEYYTNEVEGLKIYTDTNFKNLTDYLEDKLGATTITNVCAISADIAKLNNMTLAELLREYED